MQWLYRVIGQAGIFLICAQTVVHFRPKESYDKYLKLLLSVMLLLQLLQPPNRQNSRRKRSGIRQLLWRRKPGKDMTRQMCGSKILHRELLQEKTVGKYRIRRKRIGKMQKRRESMWTLHQSGWNDGEVCRRAKENDGRKTGAREEKEVRSNG